MNAPNRDVTGCVYLVGAGPGDPDLITLRGVRLLERADVVVYDYLVNPLVLAHARCDAPRICLGRHGHGRMMSQDEVNRLLVARAEDGQQVVRLKAGDPAIFARLAEEAAALRAAGVPFEIVPGITAALAAPSYAGIPLTHRDHASAVALVTGQQQAGQPSTLDYDALASFPGTLVFYMGVTTALDWCHKLISAGRSAATPAAIVRRCSLSDQEVIPCTLGEVAGQIAGCGLRPPALVLVGEVCRDAHLSTWFTGRPLFGQTVLVTRPQHQAIDLCRRLGELGAGCLLQPAITVEPPEDWGPVDVALTGLEQYDWLVFSSANGVRSLLDRLCREHGDLRRLARTKIAAIGPRTALELARYHLAPDVQPAEFRAEALAELLCSEASGRRFLLARASRGRDLLEQELEKAGAEVQSVVVYRSCDVDGPDSDVDELLSAGRIDWVTVTSSAIARSLVGLFGGRLASVQLASISPVTSATLRELGYPPSVEATTYTTAGLVEAMLTATLPNR